MKTKKFKQDKGVAGLTIMLSIIVMLFVIGLLVMIFAIMGNQLKVASYTSTTGNVVNESATTVTDAGQYLAGYYYRDAVCSISHIVNGTNGNLITTGNYTATNCNVKSSGTQAYNNSNWLVTYSYVYEGDNTATDTMNDTIDAVATTTDWFDIFIVISAMVVLILLTVIIITAIRSSGMIDAGAGTTNGANRVGSA